MIDIRPARIVIAGEEVPEAGTYHIERVDSVQSPPTVTLYLRKDLLRQASLEAQALSA